MRKLINWLLVANVILAGTNGLAIYFNGRALFETEVNLRYMQGLKDRMEAVSGAPIDELMTMVGPPWGKPSPDMECRPIVGLACMMIQPNGIIREERRI